MEDPWDMERVLAEFANEIPTEQDPYLLVKEYTSVLKSTDIPSWVQITNKVLLVSLIVLFLQALYNLYVMIALGGFTLGKKTSLGMWNFETINCNTLTSLLFSILSVIEWIWEQYNFTNHQVEYFFLQNLIAYLKFVPVILGTWNHSRRDKTSLPGDHNELSHPTLQLTPSLRMLRSYVLNHLVWVFLATFYCHSNQSREKQMILQLKNNLSLVTDRYDGSIDRQTLLSSILISMRKANSLRVESIKFLNMVILAYLIANTFLLSVFMPLLCVSWRDLKYKADFLSAKLQQEGNESSDELAELMETTQDARTTLLYRSLSVFFGLASCTPGMCWELYYSQKAFSRDYAYYRVISAFLSQGVISIFLNIHLLIVNLHCTKLRTKRYVPNVRVEASPSIPLQYSTTHHETLEIHEKPEIIPSYYH
ncbi:hypothetical protein PSTG_10660 [Puccinia striiformis f. sp. tritici PST-78]|uniref:Uncharacterized protein n=1 Tax=Puccinia striiformis f. sp. tritici PST-78 TaxID=1165861 RepID=A0A0L0V9X5_9BASI|nr:hypothetical protein PSTG_10647 [Puccinia striiformis f. sp. tritici PST-78]KNE96088.1 hypothetical protein PSTG_10660 [Puccinia striiformis f. sp. tritici PST-78]